MQTSDRAEEERAVPAIMPFAQPDALGGRLMPGQKPSRHRETHGYFRFSASFFPKNSGRPCTQRARASGNPRKDPWPCRMGVHLFHTLRGGPGGEEARSWREAKPQGVISNRTLAQGPCRAPDHRGRINQRRPVTARTGTGATGKDRRALPALTRERSKIWPSWSQGAAS